MDLDALKQCWLDEARSESRAALDSGTVSQWLDRRAEQLRRDVRRRLRQEAGYYYYIPAIAVAMILIDGISPARMLITAGLVVLLGSIPVTLWYAQSRLSKVPVDRDLRHVLVDLLTGIDATSRAYLVAYVVMFACAALVLVAVTWQRVGAAVPFAGALTPGALSVAWAYWSGRAYVRRMFRGYRSELAECLRELDANDIDGG